MKITLFVQIVFLAAIIFAMALLFRQIRASKMAKRISYYALSPLKDDSVAISDKLINKYLSWISKYRRTIKKSKYFTVKAKKYDKYIKYNNREQIQNVDFITNKFIISLVFVLITMISQVFTLKIFGIFDYVINFFLGYYLLDIYLFIDYKKQCKLIENELLRAIIIMNNAFKSGKSILQALDIASLELPEPINDEFKKMYLDMKFGLSVDTVFDRFAKRVNLEEATYIASSLTILNKTGGNIVEVFSSIERTLFDKKKLNEEIKNISANPNMVVKILLVVPIAFVLFIYILNPTYFDPLFESPLGYMIIGIIVIMFAIYAILLHRILKIEV